MITSIQIDTPGTCAAWRFLPTDPMPLAEAAKLAETTLRDRFPDGEATLWVGLQLIEALRLSEDAPHTLIEGAADADYPDCPICGEPIDYCQGHGGLNGIEDDEIQAAKNTAKASGQDWDALPIWAKERYLREQRAADEDGEEGLLGSDTRDREGLEPLDEFGELPVGSKVGSPLTYDREDNPSEPCEHGWTGPWNSLPCRCGARSTIVAKVGA
jgi:hypothetical protein